jgi:hypothetical protein
MRRSVVLALGIMLLAGLPAQAGPVPTPRVDREAWASWLVPTSKPHVFKWLGFQVETHDSLESASSMVFVVTGRCEVFKRGSNCMGMGEGTSLKQGEFEMSPDASTASLKMTRHGKRYSGSWTSEAVFGLYSLEELCMSSDGSSGQGAGAGTIRPSSVTGVYAGRKMTTAKAFGAGPSNYLLQGAAASQCNYGIKLTTMPDGSLRASWSSN